MFWQGPKHTSERRVSWSRSAVFTFDFRQNQHAIPVFLLVTFQSWYFIKKTPFYRVPLDDSSSLTFKNIFHPNKWLTLLLWCNTRVLPRTFSIVTHHLPCSCGAIPVCCATTSLNWLRVLLKSISTSLLLSV